MRGVYDSEMYRIDYWFPDVDPADHKPDVTNYVSEEGLARLLEWDPDDLMGTRRVTRICYVEVPLPEYNVEAQT